MRLSYPTHSAPASLNVGCGFGRAGLGLVARTPAGEAVRRVVAAQGKAPAHCAAPHRRTAAAQGVRLAAREVARRWPSATPLESQ